MKSLEEIASEIIEYSDGSYYKATTDEYNALSATDKQKVDELVWEEIYCCDDCGWFHHIDHMDNFPEEGATVCYSCASTRYEEEEAN